MRLYLASPLGFSEVGRAFKDHTLIPLLRGAGHVVVDPWRLTPPDRVAAVEAMAPGDERLEAWRRLNRDMGRANVAAIRDAEALVAVLDGVDVDSGTAAEIGFAHALGLPILGYRGDFRLAGDNEGAAVNLQVETFILDSGGAIVARADQIAAALTRLGR